MIQNNERLLRKLAYLEFVHDQLTTELQYIDMLLRSLGFPMGLESAKAVAQQILEESEDVLSMEYGSEYEETREEGSPENGLAS